MRRRHVDCVWMVKSDDGRGLGVAKGGDIEWIDLGCLTFGGNGIREKWRIDFDEMSGDRIGEEICVRQREKLLSSTKVSRSNKKY